MAYIADSNVLIDIFERDEHWAEWSYKTLQAALSDCPVYINPLIYAEISVRFTTDQELDDLLSGMFIDKENLPWDAAFGAGKAYLDYKRQGGNRRSPLPDFYIGAHAQVSGRTLITRDAARYKKYFPKIKLIAPDQTPIK